MEAHNFTRSLQREKTHQKCADKFYIKCLNATGIIRYNQDNERDIAIQRQNIDVSFTVGNKLINVSEKFREKNFNDLYIEFYSKFPQTPGWLSKSQADCMAYFLPEKVFLINERQLSVFYENHLQHAVSQNEFGFLAEQNTCKNAQKQIRIKIQNHSYFIRIIQAYNKTANAQWYTMGIAMPFRVLSDFGIYFKEFSLYAND